MVEITVTGKTVQDAVDAACVQLGVTSDDLVYEVVEEARSGFLGIGSKPAKIKAWQREDEISGKSLLEEMEKPQEQPHAKNDGKGRQNDKNDRNDKNNRNKNTADKKEHRDSAPKAEKPAEQRESFPFAAKAEQPEKAAEQPQEPADQPEEPEEIEEPIALDQLPAAATQALDYLKGIAKGIGAEKLEYSAVKTERGVKFIIDGEDANIIIGRRGETMDSLQYLCTLISSRASDDYCKISLDVAGYRKKREKALQQLAQREAAKVKKSHYSTTLEPMNPYERRIIHSAIQQIEGVVSESVGEEPRRRVVISPEGGGKSRRDGGRRNGGRRDGRGRRGDRRDSHRDSNRTPAVTTPSREPRNEGNGTLYAKIEL